MGTKKEGRRVRLRNRSNTYAAPTEGRYITVLATAAISAVQSGGPLGRSIANERNARGSRGRDDRRPEVERKEATQPEAIIVSPANLRDEVGSGRENW